MTSADLESFRVRGYVIFRGVFTKEEVLELRKRVGLLRTRELADGRNILREPEYPGVLKSSITSRFILESSTSPINSWAAIWSIREIVQSRSGRAAEGSTRTT
jgi:hypothetical protein